MRKIKIAIVGYGNRGQVYADYSLDEPEEVEVVAVIDPNPYKIKIATERYNLSNDRTFASYSDFLKSGIETDIVVNSTMDQFHYQIAKEILNSGRHMLMEKPVVPNKSQLIELENLAKEKGVNVFVCHVLRYSPFYKTIKKYIKEILL